MICTEFDELSPKEKTEYIGALVHSVQSDSDLYSMGQEIINMAKMKGLFDRVVILPPIGGPEDV